MVQTNWHIGRMIVEAQRGEERAAYGDGLLKNAQKCELIWVHVTEHPN